MISVIVITFAIIWVWLIFEARNPLIVHKNWRFGDPVFEKTNISKYNELFSLKSSNKNIHICIFISLIIAIISIYLRSKDEARKVEYFIDHSEIPSENL